MTEDLKALVKQKGIEYFLCSFVEMGGIPKAKLVPASALDDMVSEGAGLQALPREMWGKALTTQTWSLSRICKP